MSKSAKKGDVLKMAPEETKSGLSNYLAEPALLVHVMASLMVVLLVQDLMVEKACLVNLGYSEDVCTALKLREGADKYEEEEKEVQKLTGTVMMWRQVLENVFPMVLVLLVGAWSDKYGRKLPMLFVPLGFMVQNIALILCVYFKTSTGSWTVALVSSLIPGCVGNMACFAMAVFSYVSDTTSIEKRTFRTGITHSVFFAGLTLGLAAGAIMAKSTLGYTKVFTIGLIMEACVFVYVLYAIKNVRDEKIVKGKSTADMIADLFNFQFAKESINSVFKKRSGDNRKLLLFLLLAHALFMAPMMGEMGVMFLFTRLKFNWDSGDLGVFMTYRTVLGLLGNFVSMWLLTKVLKLTDPAVGIAAGVSALLSNMFFVVANSTSAMYLCPLVAIFSSAAMIVPRSIISKIVPANEIGKVNSFLASLDSLVPLLSGPIYTVLYKSTFEVFPSAFFLLSASFVVLPILIFWWVLSLNQKDESKEK